MPLWRCPACRTPIEHSPTEFVPRPDVRYRCHVCRLELAVDPKTHQLQSVAGAELPAGSLKPRAPFDRRQSSRGGGRRATDPKEPRWFARRKPNPSDH
jgi:hypothetical protein